jgi:hypothetical protein
MTTTRTDLRPLARPPLPQRLRERAAKALEDFRRSDRFIKMRQTVVGTWLLLTAVTLWTACPSSGPANALGADVQVRREALVGGSQVLIRNESEEIWEDVELTLDDGWRYFHRTLRPHDQLVLSVGHFRKGDQPAPLDLRPRSLRIRCAQGQAAFDLR